VERFRLVKRPPPDRRSRLGRYAAPAAFLLAATIAVLLIRSALDESGPAPATTSTAVTTHRTATAKTTTATTATTTTTAAADYHTIVSGDTFQQLAVDNHTTVDELVRLNPGVDPSALTVGQKIRIR
jgi:LysM repeat protein